MNLRWIFKVPRSDVCYGSRTLRYSLWPPLATRVLVSHDRKSMVRHFARFIASQTSPGLIIVSQELEIGIAIEQQLLVWSVLEVEELTNRPLFLPF